MCCNNTAVKNYAVIIHTTACTVVHYSNGALECATVTVVHTTAALDHDQYINLMGLIYTKVKFYVFGTYINLQTSFAIIPIGRIKLSFS